MPSEPRPRRCGVSKPLSWTIKDYPDLMKRAWLLPAVQRLEKEIEQLRADLRRSKRDFASPLQDARPLPDYITAKAKEVRGE